MKFIMRRLGVKRFPVFSGKEAPLKQSDQIDSVLGLKHVSNSFRSLWFSPAAPFAILPTDQSGFSNTSQSTNHFNPFHYLVLFQQSLVDSLRLQWYPPVFCLCQGTTEASTFCRAQASAQRQKAVVTRPMVSTDIHSPGHAERYWNVLKCEV